MTLDELPWVPGHPCATEADIPSKEGREHRAWRVTKDGANYASRSGMIPVRAGTYTIRSNSGEEWINLDPIEAQCVLNYLVEQL